MNEWRQLRAEVHVLIVELVTVRLAPRNFERAVDDGYCAKKCRSELNWHSLIWNQQWLGIANEKQCTHSIKLRRFVFL